MARNQCIVTPTGQRKLQLALRQLEEKLGRDLLGNMSKLSQLMHEDGNYLHRVSLRKVLITPETVSENTINTVFAWINKKLSASGLPVCQIRSEDYREIEAPPQKKKTKKSAYPKISPEEKFVNLLWTLDCNDQETTFRNLRPYLNPAGAVLVRAGDLKLERWLVKRLARQVHGFDNASLREIFVPKHQMCTDFNDLWRELGEHFSTEDKRDSIIQKITALCKTKTVILAFYGIQDLTSDQQTLLINFWHEIADRVRSQPRQILDSRFFLFLSTDTRERNFSFPILDMTNSQKLTNPNSQALIDPIQIKQLDWIDSPEIVDWITENQQSLTQLMIPGRTPMDLVHRINECNSRQDSILRPLNEICWACGLEEIADIKRYWNLTA